MNGSSVSRVNGTNDDTVFNAERPAKYGFKFWRKGHRKQRLSNPAVEHQCSSARVVSHTRNMLWSKRRYSLLQNQPVLYSSSASGEKTPSRAPRYDRGAMTDHHAMSVSWHN